MERGRGLVFAAFVAGALGLALGLATAGCGGGLQVYKFESRPREDAAVIVLQTLSDLGFPASPAEGNPDRIRSDWQSTGTRYGYAGGRPAKLARRFIVDLMTEDGTLIVQVKIELLACSEVAMLAGEYRAGRDCNAVGDVRPQDQRDVDRIGVALERALTER